VCREGQGVGVILVSPKGAIFEQSVRLEYYCTSNQVEYKAILLGLQILSSMGVKCVKAFGDSLLIIQQVAGVFQCFDGSLNAYLDKCLEIIVLFDDFTVQHVFQGLNYIGERFGAASIRFLIKLRKIRFSRKTGCSSLPNRTVLFLADSQRDRLFC
jgi:hypothetical protein